MARTLTNCNGRGATSKCQASMLEFLSDLPGDFVVSHPPLHGFSYHAR